MKKIACISQKGGVGKSTIANLLAVEGQKRGWKTILADMDTSQGSSAEWAELRETNKLLPEIATYLFKSVQTALQHAKKSKADLVIFDGVPHANYMTYEIAKTSDLVIIPTSTSVLDLNPQIKLAHELLDYRLNKKNIRFILSRVTGTENEINEARAYLKKTGYEILDSYIPDKTAFRRCAIEGKAISEVSFPSLKQRIKEITTSLLDEITK